MLFLVITNNSYRYSKLIFKEVIDLEYQSKVLLITKTNILLVLQNIPWYYVWNYSLFQFILEIRSISKKKKKKKINSNNQFKGNYYHFYLLFNLSPAIKYLIFKRVSRVLIKKDFGW